ncbi:MAG: lamin tail domain-containing protein [Candidatus Cloacimonetes bacterium]|nr:lamin tail domain-containing protein [Candidatus Cloacimonadota bacterium]
MKKIGLLFVLVVFSVSMVWGDIIISQYYEGASFDKWIEVTNVGTSSVDLTSYYLARWANTSSPSGSATSSNQLSGSIDVGESILYQHSSASSPSYASGTSLGAVNFNGDDPMAITTGGTDWSNRIDCIYSSGTWGENTSFYRNSDVTSGNTNESDLSGSGEWTEVSNSTVDNASSDETEYLGYHIYSSGGNTPPSISSITQDPASDITSSTTVSVSADVTDSDGTISNVELHWGTTSGSLANTINMSTSKRATYTTDSDIPSQSDGTTVYYEIEATDDDSEVTTSAEQSYMVSDAVTPIEGDLVISEVDTKYSRGVFVELYNNSGSTLDLSNVSLLHYNGSTPANVTIGLTGTLEAGGYYVIGRNQTNFEATYGTGIVDQYNSNMYLNDGDEWLELDNGSKAIIDNFGTNGVDWTASQGNDFERTGYPNNGTSVSNDWIDMGDQKGTPGQANNNTLPVTLSTFTAQYSNGLAQLYWVTQSEDDNLGWNIYRSQQEEFTSASKINNELIPGYGTTTEPNEYYYTDATLENVQQGTYWYWLENLDFGGQSNIYDPVMMEINDDPGNDPGDPGSQEIYGITITGQNPFNHATGISFAYKIKQDKNVNLSIYNIHGQLIKTIYKGNATSESGLQWNGKDKNGVEQAAGIYLCKLQVGNNTYDTKKIILLKQ